jgi:histidinol-phosphate aminotransferase
MNFNLENITRENVKGLSPYSSARDEYISDGSKMIFLDANENPYENGVNRYPDPQQRNLKTVLASTKGVGTNQILLGNGSDEVLDLLFRAFCEPNGDNVITLPPTYGMYKVLSGINSIENREVLLLENFQPDLNAVKNAIDDRTKIIFICSPNNPSGNSISSKLIVELLDSFSGLIIIDEAYIDFSPNPSWVAKLDQYPNLVVTQTLSKAYGMAGIRLGICYASKEIISILNKIKPPYNINELTQQKALERLEKTIQVKQEISNILEERSKLMEELEGLTFISKIYQSDANFILVKVDDATKRYNQLLKKGIVTRNRTSQPLCENTLRFTIGTKEENQKLMTVLKSL